MSKYPFQEQEPWPVEGFPMDEMPHVQIRIKKSLHVTPVREYKCSEVYLYFWPVHKESDNIRIKMTNKAGKVLEPRRIRQCIARFKTEEEAYRFVHHMYQSKNEKHFFPPLSDTGNAGSDKTSRE